MTAAYQPRVNGSEIPGKPFATASAAVVNTPPLTVTTAMSPVALPPAMGKLAVSSPTSAEIYQGDRFIGSTPTTIQLPAGRHTLEYRHGDLRSTVVHEIKSDETTTASVTFQVTMQINAKPWAQVFLDGPTRRALGQTPLSGVTVPIGGVLVFEHPNYPPKTYRITEKDAAVQVDFP
jgi:hypothetical protein